MTEFHKVTPDLNDPRQNEFVQDYLTAFNEKYNEVIGDDSPPAKTIQDYAAVEETIEQIQEIYNPQKVEELNQIIESQADEIEQWHRVNVSLRTRIRDLESRIRDAQDVLG